MQETEVVYEKQRVPVKPVRAVFDCSLKSFRSRLVAEEKRFLTKKRTAYKVSGYNSQWILESYSVWIGVERNHTVLLLYVSVYILSTLSLKLI